MVTIDDNHFNNSRLLVTTALEETWDSTYPMLFLSEGCLKYSRKNIWQNLNFSIFKGIWSDNNERRQDNFYLENIYRILLPRITNSLNKIHRKKYSTRYWEILIGYWLKVFLSLYFEKWKTLKVVESLYSNLKINILINNEISLNSNDCLEFINRSDTDEWNQLLYIDIAKKWTNIRVNSLHYSQSNKIRRKLKYKLSKRVTLRFILLILSKIRDFFFRHSSSPRFFLYYSYLNFKFLIKLGQKVDINLIPYLSFQTPYSETNSNFREWAFNEESDDEFLKAICEIIPRIMPKCYLEGYNKLAHFKTYWPNNPKVIMTANAFAYDDVWGAWAAHKTEFGSKLVIAQHGGTYGASEFMDLQEYEISISDKYITWGWNFTESKKIIKGPAVKLLNISKSTKKAGEDCVLVTQSERRYCWGMSQQPLTSQMPKYIGDQIKFVDSLSQQIQQKLKIRLYFKDFGWEIKNRFQDKFPNITTVDTNVKIGKLLSQSKLCVCNYNGTTFLENFVKDIPTTMYWDPEIFALNNESKPYYDLLSKVGILHKTPESCAKFINSIWNDVPDWWNSKDVKEARLIFSDHFANIGNNPVLQLKNIFTDW